MKITRQEALRILDGCHAYDMGAIDAGIKDPEALQRAIEFTKDENFMALGRELYGKPPYEIEDVLEFAEWIDEKRAA
jgi:hypothetical protein